jgi:hypothetical protein
MGYGNVSVEEEGSTSLRLLQEIGGKECNPFEDGVTSTGFEHKESNHLLEEQPNNYRAPGGPF